MLFLTAVFFGVSIACTTWLVARAYQNRRLVGGRLSEISGMSFPYNIYGMSTASVKRSYAITLDKLGHDKITKDLFLAGLRQQKNIQFFFFLIKLSIIVPMAMILLYALTGSLSFKKIILATGVGCVMFLYVHLTIRLLKQKRQKQILRTLPQFLDLVVVCVETGLSFPAALERILKEMDPKEVLIQEFSVMYHEYLGGLPLAQACDRLNKRCQVPDLSILLSAIVHSDEMGASLGNTLRTQASELRDKLRQRIRTRAFQVPVKVLFPMMLIFVAFMLLNLGYIGYQMGAIVGGKPIKKSSAQAQSGVLINHRYSRYPKPQSR